MDKVTTALTDALKQALAEPGEQRLYRTGKLPGLFASRVGSNQEAATRGLQEGLLEIVRTEEKGKSVVEWVRLTPRGVEFLQEQESPARALDELRQAIKSHQERLPAWLAQVDAGVQQFLRQLASDVERALHRLDTLTGRAEAMLRRLEDAVPQVPDDVQNEVAWVAEAVNYLEKRRGAAAPGECPLPELFAVLAEHRPGFSVTTFHEGLRKLQQRRILRLLPFAAAPTELPQPEYALPDGAHLLYYVTRVR